MQKNIHYQDKSIAYSVKGAGLPIVFLHGFCEDGSMWNDYVSEMSSSYQLISIDLPGFGQSQLIENNSIEAMADIVAAVLDEEAIGQSILIGHSMGGYVAMAFAEAYSNRLLGLGLFHSHPYPDLEEKKENRLKTMGFVQRHGTAPFVAQLLPNLFANSFVKTYRPFIDALIQQAANIPVETILSATMAMINRPDRSDILSKLTCPVLFIVGTLDEAVPKEFSWRQLSLPAIAYLQILPNAAHMGMFEAREVCLTAILEFVINIDNGIRNQETGSRS